MENQNVVEEPIKIELDKEVAVAELSPNELAEESTETQQLRKSYRALQAKFTQTSQELAELKKSQGQDTRTGGEETVNQVIEKPPTQDDVIREYLFGTAKRSHAPIVIGNNATVVQSIDGTKSIYEANSVARKFFQTKQN